MILFHKTNGSDSEFSWIAIEDFDLYENVKDSGISIYKIEHLEEGCKYDDWVPTIQDAALVLKTQFGIEIENMISTEELSKQGFDMSKYYDPDFKK